MPWNQVPKQERPPRPMRIAVPTVRAERPNVYYIGGGGLGLVVVIILVVLLLRR